MWKALAILMLSFTTVTVWAEVDIPTEKRVRNYESGVCVWCAIENLGNAHGIEQLKGIAKYRHDNFFNKKTWVEGSYVIDAYGRWIQIKGPHWSQTNEAPGTAERVHEELRKRNVKYKLQDHGNYSTSILKEAVDNNLGCAVGLMNYPRKGDYHMVTLTELTKDKFYFIDNLGECNRYEASRAWFDAHWSGYTILVYPDKTTVPHVEPRPAVRESREILKPEVKEDRE
jgi:hypothetical protein